MSASAWQTVLDRLDDAAKLADLDPDIHRLLRTPERVLEVAVPVRMDDGSIEVFTGWRVHHDTTRGPGQGRHPLPPRRRRRRGEGAGRRHDLQDGDPRPALRRGQGRRALRPDRAVAPRARAAHPPLHLRDQPAARPRPRRAGARRQHRRSGDGVADGHAVDDPGPPPARRRSPASRWPSAAPAPTPGATSSGCLVCARAAFVELGLPMAGQPRRHPGLRQGGRAARLPAALGRHARRRGGRRRRRGGQRGRPRRRRACPTTSPPPARSPGSPAASRSRRRPSGTSSASCSCRPPSAG